MLDVKHPLPSTDNDRPTSSPKTILISHNRTRFTARKGSPCLHFTHSTGLLTPVCFLHVFPIPTHLHFVFRHYSRTRFPRPSPPCQGLTQHCRYFGESQRVLEQLRRLVIGSEHPHVESHGSHYGRTTPLPERQHSLFLGYSREGPKCVPIVSPLGYGEHRVCLYANECQIRGTAHRSPDGASCQAAQRLLVQRQRLAVIGSHSLGRKPPVLPDVVEKFSQRQTRTLN